MGSDVPTDALTELASVLKDGEARYVIGGSTGLALRGQSWGGRLGILTCTSMMRMSTWCTGCCRPML